MDLSVVIPIYNEQSKIGNDIDAALAFFIKQQLQGEIIVVNDGSEDQSIEVVQKKVDDHPKEVQLISYHPNRGKGFALKKGILAASGNLIMFADSGNCVPLADARKGFELINSNEADIAHGSRHLSQSVIVFPRKWYRILFSYLFRKIIKKHFSIPREFTDTQCGFKVYKKEMAYQLYDQLQTEGFMFDIEIILLAQQYGYQIKEFPITWRTDYDSRIQISKNLTKIVQELRVIKKRF